MADVLRAGCRSVVVPFARGGETEQTRRAHLLQDRGLTAAISEKDLSAERLARTIDAAMASEPGSLTPQMNGAEATAKLLSELINSHQS